MPHFRRRSFLENLRVLLAAQAWDMQLRLTVTALLNLDMQGADLFYRLWENKEPAILGFRGPDFWDRISETDKRFKPIRIKF